MAHDNDSSPGMHHDIGLNGLTYSLAGLAGVGICLMVAALILGVIGTSAQGENADTGIVGLLFGLGVVAFFSGAIAWFFVVRPDTHFDDISVALDDGHGHDDDAHSIVVAEPHAVVAESHAPEKAH